MSDRRFETLEKQAYERLAAHKKAGEMSSEVVLRLAGERSLLDLAGILDEEGTDAVREAVAERRERRSDELEATADRLRRTVCQVATMSPTLGR